MAVDVPLPHLDRLFDYLVPEALSERAVPGCRVRIRFAGRLTGGYLVERAEATEHHGRLAFLERVLSPEPVLTEEIAGLARAVADRYGGTLADVLRLAIPPRHAAAEAARLGLPPCRGRTFTRGRTSAGPNAARRPASRRHRRQPRSGAVGPLPHGRLVSRRARRGPEPARRLVGTARS